MKLYQHKKTRELITYKDGVMYSQEFVIEGFPSLKNWDEIDLTENVKVYRIWNSGKKTLGLLYKCVNGSIRFMSHETYHGEGGVVEGENYHLGGYKYEIYKEYPLSYVDLKHGEFYTTHYKNKIIYTFRNGYDLWYNHSDKVIITYSPYFTPDDDFTEFRLATDDEVLVINERKNTYTTEDGVVLNDGETAYPVATEEGLGFLPYTFIACRWKPDYRYHEGFKFFSTEESAKEWIILNKPCLSINDIWSNPNDSINNSHYVMVGIKQIKELVKSKL